MPETGSQSQMRRTEAKGAAAGAVHSTAPSPSRGTLDVTRHVPVAASQVSRRYPAGAYSTVPTVWLAPAAKVQPSGK